MYVRLLSFLFICLISFQIFAKEKLTVLTAYPEDVVSHFETAFEQTHPDIDLVILWRMPHDALPYLRKPRQGGVDVYWSASQNNFRLLKQEGAWQPLAIDRTGLPDKIGMMPLIDPDGYYCATEMAGYGIAVNPNYLKQHNLPQPGNWKDLSDARYEGHIALPIPSKVGFAPLMIDSLMQHYGWQDGWAMLAGIVANSKLVEPGATFVTDILGTGERGLAASIDFFVASAQANGAPLVMTYPQPVAYSPAHIAITASTSHIQSARSFVSFVLSDTGQKLLFGPDIRKLPVRLSVYLEKPQDYYEPFASAERFPPVYDPAKAQTRLALMNSLFDLMFSEQDDRMKKLWHKLRVLQQQKESDLDGRLEKIRKLLTEPPIDESSAMQASLQRVFTLRKQSSESEAEAAKKETEWRLRVDNRYTEAEHLLTLP